MTKPYLARKTIRGRRRVFFRKTWVIEGKRRERTFELPADEDSAAFDREYWSIRLGTSARLQGRADTTLAALIDRYRQSPGYTRLAPSTRDSYDTYLDQLKARNAGLEVGQITRQMIRDLHNAHAATPRKADYLLQIMSLILNHAVDPLAWIGANPAQRIPKFGPSRDYPPWPAELLDAFGRVARSMGERQAEAAMELGIGTGQRPGDLLAMEQRHIEGRYMHVVQDKARETAPDDRLKVYMPERLRGWLEANPARGRFIIARDIGSPITYWQLDHAIRRVRTELGSRAAGFTPHGWRATAATELAEAGATDAEIQAVTGHRTATMVAKYRAKARRTILSRQGQERR